MEDKPLTELDETDLNLLSHIETDFDNSLEQLAEAVGLSKSAVHYRINKHRENGAIKGVTADLDPSRFGMDMMMITDVFVGHQSGYADEIGTELAEVSGINQVYYTLGDVDFVVLSRTQNRDQMNQLLDEIVGIEGINETSSRFAMKIFKADDRVLDDLTPSMRESILDPTS